MTGILGSRRAAGWAAVGVVTATAVLAAYVIDQSEPPSHTSSAATTGGNNQYVLTAAAGTLAHQQIASLDADALLAAFAPPPGATPLKAQASSAQLGPLSSAPEHSSDPNQVDQTAIWTTTGSVDSLMAWVNAHPPAGTTADGSGFGQSGGGAPVVMSTDFTAPPTPGVISQQTVEVSVAPLPSGATALRVDVVVVYLPTKTPEETLPAATQVDVTPTLPSADLTSTTVGSAVHVTGKTQITDLTALIDALPPAPAGAMGCPMDNGSGVHLVFRSASGAQLADVTADSTGCQDVTVTVGGKQQPTLSGGGALAAQIATVLGQHWQFTG